MSIAVFSVYFKLLFFLLKIIIWVQNRPRQYIVRASSWLVRFGAFRPYLQRKYPNSIMVTGTKTEKRHD